MTASPISQAIDHLRDVALREGGEPSDGQLLESFLRTRESEALARLVHRHGAMVWGVCRRMLFNHQDAEDAFQATFLVLVRRASSVRPREMIGNWLYGVAHQTALKARATTARRHAREQQVIHMPEHAVTVPEPADELRKFLDDELARLPDKYRSAFVLCELEGRSLKAAAQQLGLPDGTVASRLARGRAMLAKRLARHGLAVAGATLPLQAASGSAPAAVVAGTILACTLVAAGQAAGGVSAKAAVLADAVVKAMVVAKLARLGASLLIVIACCYGGWIAYTNGGAAQPAAEVQATQQPAPKADKPAAPPKKPRDSLFGVWDVVSVESKGDKPRWLGDAESLVFTEEARFRDEEIPQRVTVVVANDEPTRILDFTLLVPTNPQWINFSSDKEHAGVYHGIYQLDRDRLKIAVNGKSQGARPEDFDPKKGDRTLVVLKRVREPGVAPPSEMRLEDLIGHWVAIQANGYGGELPLDPKQATSLLNERMITFEEKRAIVGPSDNGPAKVFDLTFDSSRKPPRLTLTGKEYTYRFIVDLDGDKLRLCAYLRGGADDWPAHVESGERDGKVWNVDVLRRLRGESKEDRAREAAAIRARQILQGEWEVVAGEKRGVPMRQKAIQKDGLTLSIEDDTITLQEAGAAATTATLSVDPGKNPAWMDWSDLKVDGKSVAVGRLKGIYQYTIEDNKPTLRICYAKERPTEFKTIADLELDQRMFVFQPHLGPRPAQFGPNRPGPGKAPGGK